MIDVDTIVLLRVEIDGVDRYVLNGLGCHPAVSARAEYYEDDKEKDDACNCSERVREYLSDDCRNLYSCHLCCVFSVLRN